MMQGERCKQGILDEKNCPLAEGKALAGSFGAAPCSLLAKPAPMLSSGALTATKGCPRAAAPQSSAKKGGRKAGNLLLIPAKWNKFVIPKINF
jgi:hypothetical protein